MQYSTYDVECVWRSRSMIILPQMNNKSNSEMERGFGIKAQYQIA